MKVLFYSSVKDKELFHIQQFYKIDISILEELGCEVILSNHFIDAFLFWRYKFVFAYFYKYSFFVALVAKLFGKNTYFTGGVDALEKSLVSDREYNVQKLFFRLCYLISKTCIIVSKSDDVNVRRIVDGKKLSYSEHTIETAPFKCDIRQKANCFVTIGWQETINNVQRKGIDISIRLFAKLKELAEYKDSIFYIIGKKGEGTMYLERIVSELGLENAVVFTGNIAEEEKVNFLKLSKFYFQLSRYEGFGVAALEALCANNIVIHSGKGGLSNSIYEGGVLLNIDKPIDAMADELISKLRSVNYSCRESGYEKVCRAYDNNRRKKDFQKIIHELM